MQRGERMKLARFFAAVFGAIGMLLMVGSIVLCFAFHDAPVYLAEVPAAAAECTRELMEAVEGGEFPSASQYLYGQPDLGAGREPADAMSALVWDAFVGSISWEFAGECYATDSGICRDVAVTALEIPSVTENLTVRANALLAERMASAEEMSELYDEENNFRPELIEEVLREAMTQALAEDAKTVTEEVTLALTHQEGRWWVVPDQALLQLLSGGLK